MNKKSGNLIIPMAPTRQNKPPMTRNIQDKMSLIKDRSGITVASQTKFYHLPIRGAPA